MIDGAGMMEKFKENRGFSLIELLIAMAIVGIVMAAVYSTYYSQQRSYVIQEQVAAMQQNLRAGLGLMEREIRMTGYDPTGAANAGIVSMAANSIHLTSDLDGDGDTLDTNEDVIYSLNASGNLGRDTGGGLQPVAENIDALDFVYLDGDRNVTAANASVRSIEITIVARAGRVDRDYTDTQAYINQRGTVILPAKNDNFRRKVLSVEVKCRNLGLI